MAREGVEIITGFSSQGYQEYGFRLLDSFDKHGNGHDLIVYTHGIKGKVRSSVRQREQDDIPGLMDLVNRLSKEPRAKGEEDFKTPRWKQKEKDAGYSFRFDAHKFCRMVLTMRDAATLCETEYMVWLDGDTVITRDIPKGFEKRAMPDGHDYAYLGRPGKYTETGFLVFRMPEAMPVLDAWANLYLTGAFTDYSEWHSAYLFDRARESIKDIKGYNITPSGSGHVIHQCWVGSIFDHCKGKRKLRGRSPEAGKWRR
jgi:hypothetical protein